MSALSYKVPGLVLAPNSAFSSQVQSLQRDLRSLGYGKGPFDGIFGAGTQAAIEALQFDLINNDGSSSSGDGNAPVAVKGYNNGNATSITGVLDQGLAACIAAMVGDAAFPKLPFSSNAGIDNQTAVDAIQGLAPPPVPIPF